MTSRGSVFHSPASLFCLTACLLAPSPAYPAERSTFFESVDVHVVNVEVYVTDRDGKRVPGLSREDFEISEDGKPVKISNFYAIDAAMPATPAASPALSAPAPPAAAPAAAPVIPAAIPPEQRLYLTLFVDARSLTAPTRNRLLPALKSFLAGRLRPEDRLLLVRYDGSVRLLGPTSDPAALAAALDETAKESSHGTAAAAERRRLLAEINQATAQNEDESPNRLTFVIEQAREIYQSIRAYSQNGEAEVRATLGALGQLVDSLAGLPGRKAVLVVSGGLSQQPGQDLFRIWQSKFARFALRIGATNLDSSHQDTARLFDRLVEHANANRITFYTLAAPEDLSGRSAEMAGFDHDRVPGGTAAEGLNRSQPLQNLAAGTGGLSAVNSLGPLLDRMRGDLEAYYSLGYVPAHRRDGKNHPLEVKVRDRALTVRTRAAYRERTAAESTAGRTLSALLLGEATNPFNPFNIAVSIEGESKDPQGQYQVTLEVKLPMAKLVLVPRGDAHEGQMRIFVGARDTEGRVSEIQEVTVPIKVPNDQVLAVMSQNLATRVSLLLRPGEHRLAVGVRDELGNADSITTRTYKVGGSGDAGVRPGTQ